MGKADYKPLDYSRAPSRVKAFVKAAVRCYPGLVFINTTRGPNGSATIWTIHLRPDEAQPTLTIFKTLLHQVDSCLWTSEGLRLEGRFLLDPRVDVGEGLVPVHHVLLFCHLEPDSEFARLIAAQKPSTPTVWDRLTE